ncbi:MAG TPA: head GIN domain-containing protein [Flavisolibacter sp.]|nr:head GIN domain-containing protein [Flavisolibacter sp.]
MKKALSTFIFFVFTLAAFAQKVINDPNVEERSVKSFTGISVSGGIDLYISYGDEAVAVSASKPEYRDNIKTEVADGVLKIYFNNKGVRFTSDRKLKAYVSYKTLKSLSCSGGSDVKVDGTIKGDKLQLNLSGGSDFKGRVDVSALTVHQSGGSDVKIEGVAKKLEIQASGGSDFKGFDLTADVCSVHASGGSDIEITATKELSAQASGASDISYKGKPALKTVKASGASSVSQKS